MAAGTPTLGETLVDAAAIRERIAALAGEVDARYATAVRPLLLLCVLKGSLIFTADLARALSIPVEIDTVGVRSYGMGTVSSGSVELVQAPRTPLRDRDVLIVEDIVDSGATIAFLRGWVTAAGARSVCVIALLDKTARRRQRVDVEWRGFDIPDIFVVGYGLDHGERYRNLPDVRALRGL